MVDNRQGRLLIAVLVSAVLLFSDGCDKPPNRALGLYLDGVLLTEYDKDAEAVEKLKQAVKIDKNFSYAYSVLGGVYEKMDDYENSAVAYEKAVEIAPNSFKDFFSLGRVYKAMKELAKAVDAYVRACEIDPNHLHAHINAAKCYIDLEDFDGATIFTRRAEKIDPHVSEVQMLLADIYNWQEDYENAIDSYKRALEIDSNNPDVMTPLAIAYIRIGLHEPAKELLTLVVQAQPLNSKAYQHLGYCHLQLNNLNEAIQAYTAAVDIDDKDWEALRALGVAYMLNAVVDDDEDSKFQAIENWRASLEIEPDQPNSEILLRFILKYSKDQ